MDVHGKRIRDIRLLHAVEHSFFRREQPARDCFCGTEEIGATMKIVIRVLVAIVLISAGLAVGYPLGQYYGFSSGREWALVQADIVAREAGVFMPVSYRENRFHVVLRQPPGVYQQARSSADRPGVSWQVLKSSDNANAKGDLALLKP